MDDLISRGALISRFKQLQGSDTLANMFVSDVIKVVKIQPTAYDPDKVVEQVTEITDRINNYCEEIDHNIPEDERSGYKMLPDIFKLREVVKAGGVNG